MKIEAEFECPHCDAGFVVGDDAIYTNDIADECASQCSVCGEWYQLQCESVEVHMKATKAPKPGKDQSE
jgi:transcription elongation factor Elf1